MPVSDARHAEFLQKLLALLSEYDASISWSCDDGSDTHGISGEVLVVDIANREVLRTHEGNSYLDAHDLAKLLKPKS